MRQFCIYLFLLLCLLSSAAHAEAAGKQELQQHDVELYVTSW
jgi:hypothetical protein